MFNQDCYF